MKKTFWRLLLGLCLAAWPLLLLGCAEPPQVLTADDLPGEWQPAANQAVEPEPDAVEPEATAVDGQLAESYAPYEAARTPGVDTDTELYVYSMVLHEGELEYVYLDDLALLPGQPFAGDQAYIEDDILMVPLQRFCGNFHYEYAYDEASGSFAVLAAADQAEFTVGTDLLLWNGREQRLPAKVVLRGEHIYAPLSALPLIFSLRMQCTFNQQDNRLFVCLSNLELLSYAELEEELRSGLYAAAEQEQEEERPASRYVLKQQGKTVRGIRLGDSYEDVLAAYGTPHRRQGQEETPTVIGYTTPIQPGTDTSLWLCFYLEDGLVVAVEFGLV